MEAGKIVGLIIGLILALAGIGFGIYHIITVFI